jgi:hypothetical protein
MHIAPASIPGPVTNQATNQATNTDSTSGDRNRPPLNIEALVTLAKSRAGQRPTLLSFTDAELTAYTELLDDDPVASLYCQIAPNNVTAIGLCSPATVSANSGTAMEDAATSVIHIVQRSGQSATVLFSGDDIRWFGPTHQLQQGRVPDSCRRLLGLNTAPPSESMMAFVIAAWLEVLTRHALDEPGIDWESIVALHPAHNLAPSPATPSTLAAATRSLGTSLNWERFRCVIATVGGFPFGDNATEIAQWMDEGMFSRWAMGLLPSRTDALDILESTIGPATYDRLLATLCLCD